MEARNSNAILPFLCLGDLQQLTCTHLLWEQDYRYNGVGASNHASKVKANHQVLDNLLKTDHADAAGSLPQRQAEAPFNPREQGTLIELTNGKVSYATHDYV